MSKESTIREFDANRVRPLPHQPRKRFRGLKELADSIAEVGQISNGVVTPVFGDPKFDAQLVDGERRLRACQIAGVAFRAEVRPDAEAEAIFVASFAANFGKQDHDALEVAEGLDRMHQAGKSITQLGRIAGRSVTWVCQHLNLLKLAPEVRELMIPKDMEESALLSFAIAQLLVPLPAAQQIELAKAIVNGEAMSMAAARRHVLRARAKAGDTAAYRGNKTGKQRAINTIGSVIEAANDRIGIYLDMPGKDFNALIDSLDGDGKRALIEKVDEFADSLEGIAEAIKKRIDPEMSPKPLANQGKRYATSAGGGR